jgi:hypothetical protein
MTKLVDDAVRVLRDLPKDVQAAAAHAIIEYGAGYDDDFGLSDKHVGEVERRVNDPNRNSPSLSDMRHRLVGVGELFAVST